ncbi:reverse transcriptase domain-containing protein [Tanacetum coccineum]
MRTRSSSNLNVESATIPRQSNHRRSKQIVELELRSIVKTPVATMADTRTMSELLQSPTEGYGDAIVIPAILAENFKLKVELLSLVTSSQFHGFERDDPHSHIYSLNVAASGNLLNRTPRDALAIIENKLKVRISRNKPIVSKVSTTTSSLYPSPDVATLTEIVKELVLMNKATQQATVKAIEETCVTCAGPHPYYECLAAGGNTFNAYAAIVTYNQGGNGYRPQGDLNYRASNQMGPPGFPPPNVQNSQNYNLNRYHQNQGIYQASNNQEFNQQRGQNFNQGNNNYQPPNYQAPNNQAQFGPSNELSNNIKSNEATLRAMQTQMSNMKSELRNEFKSSFTNQFSSIETKTNKLENQSNQIMNMLTNLMIQMQSPLGSGSRPSNTVANPRGNLKAITTRSGVSYNGPTFPTTSSPLPKEVEREPEATKDKVQNTNIGSTAHAQPPVVQVPIQEPDVAPKTNPKPSIPYPSRLNDQKLHEKANNQMLKFLQIVQILHFNISFVDALLHMPKFASTFKSLFSNKEKSFELANTPLNENCLAVLLKKLPEKLGDLDKFLIPCDFPKLVECLALADLGASINLIPLFVWKKLSLLELTPTRMTLELANRSVSYPVGVAKDVIVKVGKFHFSADFVVVDYDVDPHVPLILGRPFLRTARALVDVYVEELILRDEDKQLIFHADNTSKHPHKHGNESINMINFIDITFSSPTTDIDIVDPVSVLKRFTDEPAFIYSSPPGDDNDDLFDLKSDNDEWRKLLYGDSYNDTHFENDKTKDSKTKSLINEANIVESTILPPRLLTSDSALLEESSEIATLLSSPFGNEDKVFNPGILILGGTHIFNDDKELILEEHNFLPISSDLELMFFLELTVIETLLSFSSENEYKVFNPRILISKGVHSLNLELSHRTYETFKIINVHPNILKEGPMKNFSFFCFCPKDKGIRGESS